MGDALGRMAMMQGEDETEKPETGEVEDAKPMQTCPKCGETFATQTESEGEGSEELTPSQTQDVKTWFEQSRPDAAMRAGGR